MGFKSRGLELAIFTATVLQPEGYRVYDKVPSAASIASTAESCDCGRTLMEVERPKRRHLHRNSKSDSRDAESAARAVLAGETAGEPKSADGRVEMIRVLRTARRSAR